MVWWWVLIHSSHVSEETLSPLKAWQVLSSSLIVKHKDKPQITLNDHYISLEICKARKVELRVCPKYDSAHPKRKRKKMMLLFSTKGDNPEFWGMAYPLLYIKKMPS